MDAGMYLWKRSGGNSGIGRGYDSGTEGAQVVDLVAAATVGATNRIVPVWFQLTSGVTVTNVGPLLLRDTSAGNIIINIPAYYTATAPIFLRFGVRFMNTFTAGLGIELSIAGNTNVAVSAHLGYYLIPV